MESSESESTSKVKDLQATLFPPTPKSAGSYFSNFLIKPSIYDDDDDKTKAKDTPSRELFTVNRDAAFVPQPPRWPTECQVLQERMFHIQYTPSSPEQYYVPNGKEVQPKPTGDECGFIVYQYVPVSAVNYFCRSSVGGSKYLLSSILCPEDDGLRFESRFESGNLGRAIKITPNYYELYLRADLYTNRHMQWFYFKVSNTKKNFLYRLSIVNFSKEDSLYNEGMRPLLYSTKDSQLHSIGWRRCGENITYYSNDNVSPDDPDQQMTYTLSFTVEFPHENDEVFLAHSYPYTYSDLEDYLTELANHPVKSCFTTTRLLCKSLAGNNVHYVTITSPPVPGDNKQKRAIVITARVHPGETPASWMMKGMMDFLTSDSGPAKELRDKFIFKLVPMLNPDGVIVGNNRCSLSAKDLNRQYRTVMRDAYPSIWYTKLMVRRLLEECGVAMYCDLHAHSRRHNIFMYGCENRRGAEPRLQEQVFPLMLHKNTADKFSFENCKFRIQKAKEGTGRVVMWMMGIANSYTMEASFAGSTMGAKVETHFSTMDLEQMGRSFCQTLIDFHDSDPRKEKLRFKIMCRLVQEGSNADEPANIQLSDYTSDDGDTSSTSSNEVGREEEEELVLPIVPPPSPIRIYKKPKPKVIQRKKVLNKSPTLVRKPLRIRKATLGLFDTRKETYTSDSSDSELENEKIQREKLKSIRKRRKKKKSTKKKQQSERVEIEIEMKESVTRTVSVCELVANEKICPKVASKWSKTPQPLSTEKKHFITLQLEEVQMRLMTLKHKLWLGIGGGDEPLSLGPSNCAIPRLSPRKERKPTKNGAVKDGVKPKSDQVKKPKPPNGLCRQPAVVWTKAKIKKSKSLPDTAQLSKEEEEEAKETKMKKRKKFIKKARTVSNAKVFLQKV